MKARSPLSLLATGVVVVALIPAAASRAAIDADETVAEQAAARAAEASPRGLQPSGQVVLPKAVQIQLQYPLLAGVDDVLVPAYRIDPITGATTEAFVGTQVWGAAYDILQDAVYFNSLSQLYRWPVGAAIEPLGQISDAMAAAQSMVALAFVNGSLYGTKNLANEAVYRIDLDTRIATVHIDYVDDEYDFGGLAADPRTGLLYGTNDDTTPHGAGVFRINTDGSATLVAAYPVGQTDIDGLAIDDSGLAYLVTDEPGSIYVLDLDSGSYLDPIPNPWTTSETFSGATWIGQSPALCNFNPIAIPSSGTGSLYPSTITVDRQGERIEQLRVHLLGVSHTWSSDLDILLVGPQGENLVLMSDAGGSLDLNEADISFDDAASSTLPELNVISSGTYQPTNYAPGDAFPLPAPASSGATQLATFTGSNPNGVWALYALDDTGGDSGQIAQGWCLDILPARPELAIAPLALTQAQAADQITQLPLALTNAGAAVLSFSLQESAPAPLKAGPPKPLPPVASATGAQSWPAGPSLSDLPRAAAVSATTAGTALVRQPFSISGVVGGGPIYYGERSLFDTAFPGLPLEDFEDGLWPDAAVQLCSAPFDATTNNACFAPGAILAGIQFSDDPLNDAGGGSSQGLAGVGSGFAGSDSKAIVSSTYVDSFNVDFTSPVHAVGADLVHFGGRRQTVEISLFDAADQLIATTQALAGNAGSFWGVYSPQPIGRINLFSLADPGDGAEGVDDIAFGSPPNACTALVDIPWLDLNVDFGLMAPGGSVEVQASFDSTGLALGTYSANLCVSSNDPLRPRIAIPVSLTVQGDAIFRDGFED